ncbi:MAG TPA: glycosyltransferase [Ktedonobacterales bacterium]
MCFRVAMFSLHTSPIAQLGRTRDAGGMNVYIRELSRELGRGGMYVDIFTRRSHPDTPTIQSLSDRVRLITIAAGPCEPLPPSALHPYVAEFTRRVARFASEQDHPYDMVHSHYWLSAAAAAPLARAWDTPHVTMFHTVERLKAQQQGQPGEACAAPKDSASAIRIESEGRIAVSADRVIVSTEHEGEQLRRLYGLGPSHTSVIPCGVELCAFTPGGEEDRADARRALGFDMPDPVTGAVEPTLLFVGRLDPIKGIELLLESVALLKTRARLVVVGGDPAGDPEVERLRALAASLGIAHRVRFPGAVPQSILPRYYRAADALVVSSRYESFGLVAVEALACGLPVVASAVGGLPSIVREGENGLLVRWRSAQSFAERLDELLSDPALMSHLRKHARPSVARFDWRRIGDRVRDLYQELAVDETSAVACSCF